MEKGLYLKNSSTSTNVSHAGNVKTERAIHVNLTKAGEQIDSIERISRDLKAFADSEMENVLKQIRNNWKGDNAEMYCSKMEQLKNKINRTADDLNITVQTMREIILELRITEEQSKMIVRDYD